MAADLATVDDVAAIWDAYTTADHDRVATLITKASAKLRHATPFDIDARIALFEDPTTVTALTALDPIVVADVVATVVKRFLVNPDGYASHSESEGPFSRSGTFVNRYDKTGSDVRGSISITEADIEQLLPAAAIPTPSSFQVGIPHPQLLIPAAFVRGTYGTGVGPAVVPDVNPGTGAE